MIRPQVILALVLHTLRSILRRKAAATLFLLTAAAVIILPAVLRGDGTEEGHTRILLGYTLSTVTFLLSAAALWVSCTSISAEIEHRQALTLFTRPVRGAEIWLGKTLGTAMLCGLLLAAAMTALAIMLPRKTGTPPPDAHLAIAPVAPSGRNVQPGSSATWTFELPPATAQEGSSILSFRFRASHMGMVRIQGSWQITDEQGHHVAEHRDTWTAGRIEKMSLPAEITRAGNLTARFTNHEDPAGASALFTGSRPVEIKVYRDTFTANFIRAYIGMAGRLLLLAALGALFSAAFSTPVSVFAGGAAMLILEMTPYIHRTAAAGVSFQGHTHGPALPYEPGVMELLLTQLFRCADFALSPWRQPAFGQLAAEGTWISWHATLNALLAQGLLSMAVLGAVAAFILRRKEIGASP